MMSNAALYVHDHRTADRQAARTVVRGALWLSLVAVTVLPHSFQLFEAALLLGTTLLCLSVIERDEWLNRILLPYFLGVLVTAVYVFYGSANGAARGSTGQTLLIYIIAPFMWIVMGTAMAQLWGIEKTVRHLIRFTWWATISVALIFWAFLTIGRNAVLFLFDSANVNVSNGFAGANLLVYGSLIFLAGGLFAQPLLVRARWSRFLLPAAMILCVLTSGRSALALAVPIGFLTGIVLRNRVDPRYQVGSLRSSVTIPLILVAIVGVMALALIGALLHTIDLTVIFNSYYNKVLSGGGDVRTEQAAALLDGVRDTYGLGAGHGVGVSYIRNTEYPWRYEIIPLASLYRVGVLGTLVYALPFVFYGIAFLRRAGARLLRPEDVYMMGGFLASAAAAWTNPYIESFVFQWMFFVPVMSLAIEQVRPDRGTAG